MTFFVSCNLANKTHPKGKNSREQIPLTAYPSSRALYPEELNWEDVLAGHGFVAPIAGYYEIDVSFIYVVRHWQKPKTIPIQLDLTLDADIYLGQPLLRVAHPMSLSGTAAGSAIRKLERGQQIFVFAEITNGDWKAGWTVTGGTFVAKLL